MAEQRFIDPHIQYKERDVRLGLKHRHGYPMFSLVEVNLWGACNRRCEFCPVSKPEIFTNRKEGVSIDNYEILLKHLKEIDFTGVILWSMFSEPTLHKDIYDLAKLTKILLPDATLQMTSNGDWIRTKEERLQKLIDSGVDRINLSLYDGPEQFKEFQEIMENRKLSTDQVKLRRRYQQEGNYGITISNRTGLIDATEYKSEEDTIDTVFPIKNTCYYPFYQVAIDFNGDVLLCPHDWGKKLIAGNAFKSKLWDIWIGKHFSKARTMLAAKNRSLAPCRLCDVAGDLIGSANFEAFTQKQ